MFIIRIESLSNTWNYLEKPIITTLITKILTNCKRSEKLDDVEHNEK